MFSVPDVIAFKEIDTGHNSAGNGGNGSNWGDISSEPNIKFEPSNHWGDQTNVLLADQSQHVAAGIGGNGGNYNSAEGGDVSLAQVHDVWAHDFHDFVHV